MTQKPVTPILCRGFRLEHLSVVYRLQEAVDWGKRSDVYRLFDDILARIRQKVPMAQSRWEQEQFWKHWRTLLSGAISKLPLTPQRVNPRPMVWLLGSHRYLDPALQQRALQVCRTLARVCLENQIQIVFGTSRMLEYLGDVYVDYGEDPQKLAEAKGEPLRKTMAEEHALLSIPGLNPIVLLGSLRTRGIRETFDDAIGRIPDIAILVGGRIPENSSRASQESQLAIDAGIPFLPLQFTGGAAARENPNVHESLKEKVRELQTLSGNLDRLGPLILEIIEMQVALVRSDAN